MRNRLLKKKIAAVATAAILALGTLTGCGGSSNSKDSASGDKKEEDGEVSIVGNANIGAEEYVII